jgi:hypothetical protein
MSLEQALAANTAALEANTAALTGAKPAAAAGKPAAAAGKPAAAAGKTTKTEYVPTHSKAEAQALANRVKEEKGVPDIRAIIKGLGYEKLADIAKPEDLDKLAAAALEALGESEGADDSGDDSGI